MDRHQIREAIMFLLYQHYELNKDIFECSIYLEDNDSFVLDKEKDKTYTKKEAESELNNDIFYKNIVKYLSDDDKLEVSYTNNKEFHPSYNNSDFYNDEFFKSIITDIDNNEQLYIQEISKLLNNFTFDRLNNIDKAILVMATSELALFNSKEGYISEKETSKKYIIDEALNIAKKYSSSDNKDYKFINAVLDKINV